MHRADRSALRFAGSGVEQCPFKERVDGKWAGLNRHTKRPKAHVGAGAKRGVGRAYACPPLAGREPTSGGLGQYYKMYDRYMAVGRRAKHAGRAGGGRARGGQLALVASFCGPITYFPINLLKVNQR